MSAATAARPPLVLASASPRRRALLHALGVSYRVMVPRVDEAGSHPHSIRALVTHNARLKARAVAGRVPGAIVLAADTVVALDGRVFGKPRDRADARRMLRALSGRTHRVYSGVCIIDARNRRRWTDVRVSRVTFRRLSPTNIDRYLDEAKPWDKAGAYAVQDARTLIVDRITGSLSNVIGLPLDVVERRLRQCGIIVGGASR